MVISCVVGGCTRTWTKNRDVCWVSFPKNAAIRRQWVRFVNTTRSDFRLTEFSKLCTAHFTEDCVDNSYLRKKQLGLPARFRLKAGSVPTIKAPTLAKLSALLLSTDGHDDGCTTTTSLAGGCATSTRVTSRRSGGAAFLKREKARILEEVEHEDYGVSEHQASSPCMELNSKVKDSDAVVCSKQFVDGDILQSNSRKRKVVNAGEKPNIFMQFKEEDMPAPRTLRGRKILRMPDFQDGSETGRETPDLPTQTVATFSGQNSFIQKGVKKIDIKLWQQDDDYSVRNYAGFTPEERLEAAMHYIDKLQEQILVLRSQQFCLERFSSDPDLISFYTGFPNYQILHAAFVTLQPTAERITRCSLKQCRRLQENLVSHQPFCHENLALIDQFFLFLVKVKHGSLDQDLAFRFGVSASCVRQVILTWTNYLYTLLGAMPIWPSRSEVDESLPECFKLLFRKTRVILHCVELRVEDLPSPDSSLKEIGECKEITCKGLIGISPAGGVTFVSSLFTSPISNKKLTARSLFKQVLDPGDQVMVDEPFHIEDELRAVGALLVAVPDSVPVKCKQLPYSNSKQVLPFENLQNHVERAILRVGEYGIFDKVIPLTMANQIWTVCCLLTNFKGQL